MNTWWAVDRVEGGLAVLVPAYFETVQGQASVRATRAMRAGQVFRWNGRTLTRDKAYERKAAAAARAAYGPLIRGPAGGLRL